MVMGKNAEQRVGKTITWVGGFVIVSFVMFLLIIGSNIYAGSRWVSGSWDKVDLVKYESDDLMMQRILISFLSSGDDKDINDLIFEWDSLEVASRGDVEAKIENGVGLFFSELGDCYVLVIDRNKEPAEEIYKRVRGMQGAGEVGKAVEENLMMFSNMGLKKSDVIVEAIEGHKRNLLNTEGIIFPLILDDKEIRLNFYYGDDCL